MAADFLTAPFKSRGAPFDQTTNLLKLDHPDAIRAVASKLGDACLDLSFVIQAQERVALARARLSPESFLQGQSREEVVTHIQTVYLLNTLDHQLRDTRGFMEHGPKWPDKFLADQRSNSQQTNKENKPLYENIQANAGQTRANPGLALQSASPNR